MTKTTTPAAGAWGIGLATVTDGDQRVLEAWYPSPALGLKGAPAHSERCSTEAASAAFGLDLSSVLGADRHRRVEVRAVATVIADLAQPPADTADVYLRLHLLSHRLVRPNSCSLDGIFGLLPTVVWTSAGPCAPEGFEATRLRLRAAGRPVHVFGVDKFPRLTDYVVPSGVRIAHADRVRLGAHLAEGTTVMHEGFVNFNAGTLGAAMVEGRISQGVLVGDGTDLGGGASIMGTLSGGGKEVVSVGERCLIGANGGIGISLGDDCVVEAGLYVTAGTRVTLPDGEVVKAGTLSGRSGMLFIRNSETGAVEVRARSGRWGELNAALHHNA